MQRHLLLLYCLAVLLAESAAVVSVAESPEVILMSGFGGDSSSSITLCIVGSSNVIGDGID